MKDLISVSPATGKSENYGVVCKKRMVGKTTVWLTYAEHDKMWWIVMKGAGMQVLGFVEPRREACWETFFELTEAMIIAMADANRPS